MDWITMAVRMKLDLVGLKMRLRDWQALPMAQRRALQDAPTESEREIDQFGQLVTTILREAGRDAPQPLSETKRSDVVNWKDASAMPQEVREMAGKLDVQINWTGLDRFGRYVLWSLAKTSATERFVAAASELTA